MNALRSPDEAEQMIVSHQHKFIFIKPRKVAGTSFEIALSKYLSEGDIITPVSRRDEAIRTKLGFIGPRNFHFGFAGFIFKDLNRPYKRYGWEFPQKFYNHIPAKLARSRLPAEVWRSYRKISLVRNPWDRAVSIFFWKNSKVKGRTDLADFTRYFQAHPEFLEINHRNYTIDDRYVIDDFIRYEHFEEDILKLEQTIPGLSGLWETFRDINAKGDTRDRTITTQDIFREHPAVNAMIEAHNAWEIRTFGYSL